MDFTVLWDQKNAQHALQDHFAYLDPLNLNFVQLELSVLFNKVHVKYVQLVLIVFKELKHLLIVKQVLIHSKILVLA